MEESPQKSSWIKIYSSPQAYRIELARGILDENGIEGIVVNRQDSAYLFGEIELYVKQENALRASHIIQNLKNSFENTDES
ncbi:MAG: DUF2007 domain-containing protein [Chitinophagales bacterium]|nr:DUF2007 domain-containing protein [Bacteroidota bacterium]